MQYRVLLPCLFGLEALVKDECLEAEFHPEQIYTEDGEISLVFNSLEEAAAASARMNFRSRCAERVLLELVSFEAKTFDELFDACSATPWEDYVDQGMAIHIKGYSRKSQLFGISACQSIIKKAITERLIKAWKPGSEQLSEDREMGIFQLQFSIVEDRVGIALDTTGDGLHKRSYRPLKVAAPIRESLAAAILQLSFYERHLENNENLVDLCCGSGTFAIEAAMIQAGIAPGLKRHFSGEKHRILGQAIYDREREYARLLRKELSGEARILAQDIDSRALEAAKANAKRAGVEKLIKFRKKDLFKQSPDELREAAGSDRLLLVANPPYGDRLLTEDEARKILEGIGKITFTRGELREGMRLSVITPDKVAEEALGKQADRRRKLYNGNIPCQLFHYFRQKKQK